MTDLNEAVPVVGSPSGDADLRVYNVIVYCGYVESARHAPLIFQNYAGFSDAKEALIHLHDSLAASLNQCIEWGDWKKIDPKSSFYDYPKSTNLDVLEYIDQLQPSDNDQQPAGYGMWKELNGYGWTFPGDLVTGVCVTIVENGASFLADKKHIENQWKAFHGEYIPTCSGLCIYPDFELNVLMVSSIPRKAIKTPGE